MFPRRFLFIALAAFVVLALVLSNGAAQQQAWQQGYLMGRLSAEGNGGNAAPLAPFMYPGLYGYGGWAGPHFGGFGTIVVLGLLLFLGLAALRCFFGGHRHGGPWTRHGWGQPGQRPPWEGWGWGDQPDPEQAPGEGPTETGRA